MSLPFLPPRDPRLFLTSTPVESHEIGSRSFNETIEHLMTTAAAHQADPEQGILVGLAASQIGIPRRIILIDTKANGRGQVGELKVIINPHISHRSTATQEWYEGCYSTQPVCGVVERPTHIKLAGLDIQNRPVSYDLQGYTARIAMHELDHLEGKFFIDLISDDAKLHLVEDKDYPAYRDAEGWRNWTKRYPRTQWEALKRAASH
jgi:peptide deformylase